MSTAEVAREPERFPQFRQHHRLQLALEESGMTVQEMADYLDVRRESVSRWLNGRTVAKKQTLRLWALRTGVDLEWLETGKLPRLDSNQEPADYPYDVVSLDIYRARKRVA